VLDLLAPQPGERILDLGCGDGALTEKLRDAGAIVVGVDGAPDMVRAAQARGLDARVGEFGGQGNVAAIVTALNAALTRRGLDASRLRRWYPTAERYAAMLQQGGFTVHRAWLLPRPTLLPTGMAGWLSTFADPFLADMPPIDRAALMEEVVALLAPALRTDTGEWIADYVRLRFQASKPGSHQGASQTA
jgi:hypothetical protein